MYDVVVVGAGPAGIFTCLQLAEMRTAVPLSIMLVDRGPDIGARKCPASDLKRVCKRCARCALNSGWGGAGLFSDGKITLSTSVGGWLLDILGGDQLSTLLGEVDDLFLRFGAPREIHGLDNKAFEEWHRKAALVGLRLERNVMRHIGTDLTKSILSSMRDYLDKKVQIVLEHQVKQLVVEDNLVRGVELAGGDRVAARYVVVAPGRAGSEWLQGECSRLGIATSKNPVDLGVRVELPYEIMAPITDALYEPKLRYVTKRFDDQVRTFCVNPRGDVIAERYDDIITVNGHSLSQGSSENTNFAVLVSMNFTEPFRDPLAYGMSIARLANNISSGVIVQRLGDLLRGRRSTSPRIDKSAVIPTLQGATPGDLSFVLPFRVLADIVETIKTINGLVPGVASKDTLLYGVEAKFYSSRVQTNDDLEATTVKNLFVAGDGAGLTRGLSQAAVCGIHVAKKISNRMRS